ncbi:MAG: hypothetical protein HC888_00615 [Candidatus Competibacteraceae bacterium]|nr:hypothetical protein [Candidatus Competibacteraceae bacterium]
MKLLPAKAIELSENRKTGPCSVTYVSMSSCPDDCPLLDQGCYAINGPTGIITAKLNASRVRSPEAIANLEASMIDELTGRWDLRPHIVGDCKTNAAALILSESFERYIKRSEQFRSLPRRDIWLYTHSWRRIARESWGFYASVLASVHKPSEIKEAADLGYAAAIVVPEFQRKKIYELPNSGGWSVIPCRYQTENVQCVDCRLCMRDDYLRDNKIAIAFAPHSSSKSKVERIALKMFEDDHEKNCTHHRLQVVPSEDDPCCDDSGQP